MSQNKATSQVSFKNHEIFTVNWGIMNCKLNFKKEVFSNEWLLPIQTYSSFVDILEFTRVLMSLK